MSFFNYKPQEPKMEQAQKEPEPKTPSFDQLFNTRMVIDAPTPIKELPDNPDIPILPMDVGIAAYNHWQPFNYDPKTGEVFE